LVQGPCTISADKHEEERERERERERENNTAPTIAAMALTAEISEPIG
jgi:hypothetical protein